MTVVTWRSSAVRAVRRDIVKEEELLTRDIVPHEEGRGLVVARRESFTCRSGITPHGHAVAKDSLVCLVKVQPLGREALRERE
jgi:hypothetical protein